MNEEKIGELYAKTQSIQNELSDYKRNHHEEIQELKSEIDGLVKDVREIRLFLSKWKGFVGGIAAVVSLAWAGITFLVKHHS